MAALERAIALEKMNDVAMPIPEDLNFDVARSNKAPLYQHGIVTEGGHGLPSCGSERLWKILFAVDPSHSLATATGAGLDKDRVADQGRLIGHKPVVLFLAMIAWNNRDPGLVHQRLCRILQSHGANGRCLRSNEDDARGLDGCCEIGILGQKP